MPCIHIDMETEIGDDAMIKNHMETLVDEIFNEVETLYDECLTEKCIHNIKARALNNLPTCYLDYDADEGEIKAFLLERQRRITVLAQIAEAAESICSLCSNRP